jgi:hypothetical protein
MFFTGWIRKKGLFYRWNSDLRFYLGFYKGFIFINELIIFIWIVNKG